MLSDGKWGKGEETKAKKRFPKWKIFYFGAQNFEKFVSKFMYICDNVSFSQTVYILMYVCTYVFPDNRPNLVKMFGLYLATCKDVS